MAECINFDGETDEDLLEISKKLDKEIDALTLQRRYISESIKARHFRKEGNIKTAMRLEQNCETIYKLLPEELRW